MQIADPSYIHFFIRHVLLNEAGSWIDKVHRQCFNFPKLISYHYYSLHILTVLKTYDYEQIQSLNNGLHTACVDFELKSKSFAAGTHSFENFYGQFRIIYLKFLQHSATS